MFKKVKFLVFTILTIFKTVSSKSENSQTSLSIFQRSVDACGEHGICDCSKFGTVNCSDKQLSSLPQDIPKDTVYLYLMHNQITKIPLDFFHPFNNLTKLTVSYNKLQYPFKLPKNIYEFSCCNNELKTADVFFKTDCSKLSYVDLTSNQIEGFGNGAFQSCSNIKKLVLNENSIFQITNQTFLGLTGILKLRIKRNPLHKIEAGAFSDICKSVNFIVIGESPDLFSLPSGLFRNCSQLQGLVFTACGFTRIEHGTFTGLKEILEFSISRSFYLQTVPDDLFSGLQYIATTSIVLCNLTEIPVNLFYNVSLGAQVHFGYNRLKTLPADLFPADNQIQFLLLQHNEISSIPANFFQNLTHLREIFLFGNNLRKLASGMFLGTNLLKAFLFRNKISVIEGEPFTTGSNATIEQIDIRDNPIRHISGELISSLQPNATLTLNCETVILSSPTSNLNIHCVSTRDTVVIKVAGKGEPRYALIFGGFQCGYKRSILTTYVNCTSCPTGTYGNKIEEGCFQCPAGGFYQDKVGTVPRKAGAISCKHCNPGTYVPLEVGNSSKSCQVCPQGTNKTRHAGFRACFCLENYYRKDRFGKCQVCPENGLECSHDTVTLKPGYYWNWSVSNISHYKLFVANMKIINGSYDRKTMSYNYTIPIAYKCPQTTSCTNNMSDIEGKCLNGHQGWMCTVCQDGYIKLVGFCTECSSLLMFLIDLFLLSNSLLLLVVVVMSDFCYQRPCKNQRPYVDEIFSRIKIGLGFYQIASYFGIQMESIPPKTLPFVMIASRFMKALGWDFIEIFRIPSCFLQWFDWNPYSQLKLTYILFTIVCVMAILSYIASRLLKSRPEESLEEATSSNYILQVFIYILFISYTQTCYITFQLFFCDSFFLDELKNSSISVLHSDYSINCNTISHDLYKLSSVPLLIFVTCFPAVIFAFLRKYSKVETAYGNLTKYPTWIYFFCENYKPEYWYWEIIELTRKLVMTLLVVINEQKELAKMCELCFSTCFIMLYIQTKPLKEKAEARLQLTSLLILHGHVIFSAVELPEDMRGVIFVLISVLNMGFALIMAEKPIRKYLCNHHRP